MTYARLEGFRESVPLADADGRDTLWESVIYPRRRDGRAEGRSQVRLRAAQGPRRPVRRRPPLRRSDRLLQLRQLAAVPDPDRQQHQREPRLLLRQAGGRLARVWPRAGAPAVAEPAQLRHARRDAGRGARRGRAGRRLHQALAGEPRDQADPRREGAGEVQRALLHPAARRHAQLQLRLRADARLRGLAGAHPRDGLRSAVVQRAAQLLPAPVLPRQPASW